MWVAASCSPELAVAPDVIVAPAHVSLNENNVGIAIGRQRQLSATFKNEEGIIKNVEYSWRSADASIATVNANGLVTAISQGQTIVIVQYQQFADTAQIQVVTDAEEVAQLNIEGFPDVLVPNQTYSFRVRASNGAGNTIRNPIYSLVLADTSIATIINDSTLLAKKGGTTTITAVSGSITSNTANLIVARVAQLVGINGYSGSGTAHVFEQGGRVHIKILDNFTIGNGPDFRVYLSNSLNGRNVVSSGIEIATLSSFNGSSSYIAPVGVSLFQYNHLVIYCLQFNVVIMPSTLS